jgi:hypothetical protein
MNSKCSFVVPGEASSSRRPKSIRDLNMPRRTLGVASAQNAAAEDLFIRISRSVDVGDGDEMCHGEPVARGHIRISVDVGYGCGKPNINHD